MGSETGKYIIAAGLLITIAGIVIYFFHNKLHWVGRLPGDIRVERENFSFYFPFTTGIIFSILLAIIIQAIKKFF
jgi:hypothetical protein